MLNISTNKHIHVYICIYINHLMDISLTTVTEAYVTNSQASLA